MRVAIRAAALALSLNLVMLGSAYALNEDFDLTGDIRLRLRNVDSGTRGPLQGTYGEFLSRGFSQKHRLVFEIKYPVGEEVTVGGRIRVSNEDEEILESGPEYLSSEFGSVFISYLTPRLSARFGYYPIAFTPLSLMRWDLKDDPEGGGGGCATCPGTPGVAGTILGETLEELSPELTFEGLKTVMSPYESASLEGFFARPEIAGEHYPVLTFGGRLVLRKYMRHAFDFAEISLFGVRSREDDKEGEGSDLILPEPFRNTVLGMSWKVPFAAGLSLEGEWTLTRSINQDDRPDMVEGKGGIISALFKPVSGISLETSYIYLSPNWDSYFRALSYSYNRRGLRMRADYTDRRLVLALFGRYLETIDPVRSTPLEPERTIVYPTLSARAYYRVTPDVNLGLAAVYSGEGPEEDGVTLDVEETRLTLLGTLTADFGKDSSITLEERYIKNDGSDSGSYDLSMMSLYVRSAVW
jgi:hypothetical protein